MFPGDAVYLGASRWNSTFFFVCWPALGCLYLNINKPFLSSSFLVPVYSPLFIFIASSRLCPGQSSSFVIISSFDLVNQIEGSTKDLISAILSFWINCYSLLQAPLTAGLQDAQPTLYPGHNISRLSISCCFQSDSSSSAS